MLAQLSPETRTLIDALLEEQRDLTAVERFARWHDGQAHSAAPPPRMLIPLTRPAPGEQYAFEVDLDRCSGCKSCVTACHALNGLDEDETWRSTGVLHGRGPNSFQQTVTTACHHCVEPGCLEGCPVLAYDKDPVTGIVRHLDDQCIGCQYCIFMCPYEVPKYSERRGIVRKCDMCQQRLAHSEAPACAQACPNGAIQITIVAKEALRGEFRPDIQRLLNTQFLPASPDPALTLPTTRYVSAQRLYPDLVAGDSQELPLQPAHVPLVFMLVLTQLGAGGFALLPISASVARPALATIACISSLLGLLGSVLHLGQPRKAWRAFLGVRHSWLSREIVGFGTFGVLGVMTTLASDVGARAAWLPVILWLTSITGLLGVLCSGLTYHVTRRECWRGELSVGRFFGTTLVLGAATAWLSSSLANTAGRPFAVLLVVTSLAKLTRELAWLRHCPDDAELNHELPESLLARSSYLMRFRLGPWLRMRLACAWLGGVVLPLLTLVAANSTLAVAALVLCLAGELAERALFFRAAATRRMPGALNL